MSEPDDYIISQPTENLVAYYHSENSFSPLEFDSGKEQSFEHKKYIKTIYAHEREGPFQNSGDLKIEAEKVILKIPLAPNQDLDKILNLRTGSFSSGGDPEFALSGNNIVLEIETKGYGFNISNEDISSRISNFQQSIQNYLTRKSGEILAENVKLEQKLTQFINDRKEKLDSDKSRINDLVKLIKIPLVRKENQVVQKIQVDKKPFVNKIKPKTANEDYVLDREKVIDIITLINNQCLQFEKTPKTYEKMDEPNLRDLILANLNSIFEGKATGETFNNEGKTDIYLNIDKGNILVAECKFYGGKVLYHETTDQLLRYLSWRHNYGIMINFCKQRNFQKIIDDAKDLITTHPSYNKGFVVQNTSHFISKNTLPSDEYKHVEIHHLFYNLYYK
jgi:hypothetical protein